MTMTMTSKVDEPPPPRQCYVSAILLTICRHPLLLLVFPIFLVFVCQSHPRHQRRYCVVGADAFAIGGVPAGARSGIERFGSTLHPSQAATAAATVISTSKSTSAIRNHNHRRHRETTMGTNIQQQQQQQQRLEKISSISSPAILDNYDTFLLDMWGGKSRFRMTNALTFIHALSSSSSSLMRYHFQQ